MHRLWKIDVDRPCIGICQDKRVALVLAGDFNRATNSSNPLSDAWLSPNHTRIRERSCQALQAEAVRMLSEC